FFAFSADTAAPARAPASGWPASRTRGAKYRRGSTRLGMSMQLLGLRDQVVDGARRLVEFLAAAAVDRAVEVVRVKLHPQGRDAAGNSLRQLDQTHLVGAESRERNGLRSILAGGREEERHIGADESRLGEQLSGGLAQGRARLRPCHRK